VAGAVVAGTAAAHPDREYPAACRRLSFLVPRISLYTTQWCGYCMRAKALLDARGLRYEEISLDDDPAFRQVVLRAWPSVGSRTARSLYDTMTERSSVTALVDPVLCGTVT
jgi:hypothetical protein